MRGNEYSDDKILAYPDKLLSFREGKITAPIYVRIKPTNRCNHDCWWCIYAHDYRKEGERSGKHLSTGMHDQITLSDSIPLWKLEEALDDLYLMQTKAVTFSGGGEPLFYPGIVQAMRKVIGLRLRLSIITNGQALNGERAEVLCNADWVRVSMDYTNAQQMAASRGVPEKAFDQILENLKAFACTMRPTCQLWVNYVINQTNYTDLVDFAHRLRDIGVDGIRFSPMWCENFKEYHEAFAHLIYPQIDKLVSENWEDCFTTYSTFELSNETKGIERGCDRCFYMQTVPVIGADQNVYACHHKAYDQRGLIGSIKHQSFRELWFSDEAKMAFERLNPKVHCRHECANHHKVKMMHYIASQTTDPFI